MFGQLVVSNHLSQPISMRISPSAKETKGESGMHLIMVLKDHGVIWVKFLGFSGSGRGGMSF